MIIDWFLEIKTDDGLIIFENDARVDVTLEWNDKGSATVDVSSFEIGTSRSIYPDVNAWENSKEPASFSITSDKLWMKHLFLTLKEQLEIDEDFIDAVVEEDGGYDAHHKDPHASQRLLPCELV